MKKMLFKNEKFCEISLNFVCARKKTALDIVRIAS